MEEKGYWSNAAFLGDDGRDFRSRESYQIPRVGASSKGHNGQGVIEDSNFNGLNRTPGVGPLHGGMPLEAISYASKKTPKKYDLSPSLSSEFEEDYSLKSYFRHWWCYESISWCYKGISQKIDLHKLWRRLKISLALILMVSYLLFYGIVLQSKKLENHWCSGHGFLAVLSSMAIILLVYFQIFKPLLGRRMYRALHLYSRDSTFIRKCKKILDLWYVKLILYLAIIVASIAFLVVDSMEERSRLISLLGIFVLVLFGFLFSAAPRKVIWRPVLWGLGLQFVLGLLILRWSVGRAVFSCLGDKVHAFLSFTDKGSSFVYGQIVTEFGVFAFKILSTILFFGFFVQILYYYGIMQWIVMKLGWLLQITIGTTACESVNAAANIFLGQSEAPLLIKPFLSQMTKSELHAVMTGGFATIAGSVLAAYISFGVDASHLLSASVMSAPAALGFAKLFYPEVEVSKTSAKDIEITPGTESNVLHAACEGVVSAIPLVANITANLIAFIAFIAFLDAILGWTCVLVSIDPEICTLSNIFGYVFMPLAWVMGVPWQECYYVGQLIGTKTIINEFIGYKDLTLYIQESTISKRSQIIATYALCGFSNISAIGIQIGALGSMAPERRGDLARIAFRAMIAGSIACFLTACVAGSLLTGEEVLPALNATDSVTITTLT